MAKNQTATGKHRSSIDRTSWQPKGSGRRSRRARLWAAVIILVLLVSGTAYLLVFSSLFWVSSVAMQGTTTINAEELRAYALAQSQSRFGPVVSNSIFLVNEAALADSIKRKYPDLAQVTVGKKYPKTLFVDVAERQTTLLWKSAGNYYLVDRQGVAFEQTQPQPGLLSVEDSTNLPVEIDKQIVTGGFIKALEEIKQGTAAAGIVVSGFRIPETTFEVQAVTNQGYYAIFDTTRPIATQVDALKRAVATSKPGQYADLRVPGRVYLR